MVQQGIAPERLNTVSKGESEPAVPNDTEPNRKLNRRAVFDISLPGAAPAAK
jgi:outer membrane protein OmpA-like peptidoglycan-associated protein